MRDDDPYYSKHLTDANGDFAIELIKNLSTDQKPFFINLWWLVPHKPYEPAPEPQWSKTKADGISEDQLRFRSMVQHMDAKVGQILKTLDKLGIADNTLVLFTSDKGAAFEGFIGKLKGGKTDLHDGGLRVPMIANKPEGPYVKYKKNPIIPGNHEVIVWPQGSGVAAMIGTTGPKGITRSILYSEDGLHFSKTHDVVDVPTAAGAYRPEAFTDSGMGKPIQWGVHIGKRRRSLPFIERFDLVQSEPGGNENR